MTYRHTTGAGYIEKVRELLDKSIGLVEGYDDYNLMYDDNEPDYNYIGELYAVTDLDIYIITEDVTDSPNIKKELGVPVIPIHYKGYTGKNEIREVINPETVDVLPFDMLNDRAIDDRTVKEFADRISDAARHINRAERSKRVRKLSREAVVTPEGLVKVRGYIIRTGTRILDKVGDGAAVMIARVLLYLLALALVALLAKFGIDISTGKLPDLLPDVASAFLPYIV